MSKEAHKNIYEALAAFSGEKLSLEKEGYSPYTNSYYSTIDDIVKVIREPLSKHGLSIVQVLEYKEGVRHLKTILYHSCGEKIESDFALPDGKNMQAIGTNITYAKRYAISAMLNLGHSEDDDGGKSVIEEAELEKKKAQEKKDFDKSKEVLKEKVAYINNEQINTLYDLLENQGELHEAILSHLSTAYKKEVTCLEEIKQEDYTKLLSQIKAKLAKMGA